MKPEVKVGQVWKEKDKRFTRFVCVVGWRERRGETKARIRTCLESGRILIHSRVTSIRTSTLRSRFELTR